MDRNTTNEVAMGTLVGWFLLGAFAGPVIIVVLVYNLVATKLKLATLKKQVRELQDQVDAVEYRLQLAHELNSGDTKTIADVRTEVPRLREKIGANAGPVVDEILLKEIEALAITNSTTDHILHAENLAIGDVENKPKLRLVGRRYAPV